MQATLKQRSNAIMITKELGIELPKEQTVDAYAEWLAMYMPVYVKERSETDMKSITDLFAKRHRFLGGSRF